MTAHVISYLYFEYNLDVNDIKSIYNSSTNLGIEKNNYLSKSKEKFQIKFSFSSKQKLFLFNIIILGDNIDSTGCFFKCQFSNVIFKDI